MFCIIWASTRENLSSGSANNKGADQPAHPRRLLSTFVIRCLESIISKLASNEISIFQLVSVVEETGLCLAMSEAPETGFVAMRSIQTSPWCSTRNRSLDEITVISYLVLGSTRNYLLQNFPSNKFKIYQYLY